MKITPFSDIYSVELTTGEQTLGGGIITSGGSNSGGVDVVGESGNFVVVQLQNSVALGSNLGTGVNVGDELTIISTGPGLPVARFATPSNSASFPSNAMTRTLGGQSTTITVSASGAAYSVDVGAGNYWDITLNASAAISFRNWPASPALAEIGIRTTEDSTGGWTPTFSGITWIGGSTPTHTTTANTVTEYVFWSDNGGTTIYGGQVGVGSTSPLTTKGDLFTYTTVNARLAVGSNITGLVADSTATAGIRWTNQRPVGELLMQDGVSAPPIPLESDPGRTDWLYEDL